MFVAQYFSVSASDLIGDQPADRFEETDRCRIFGVSLKVSVTMHSPQFGMPQMSSFGPPVSDTTANPQMVNDYAAQAAQHAVRTGDAHAAQQAAAWAARAAGHTQAMGPTGPLPWQSMQAPQPFTPSRIPGLDAPLP